MSYINIELLPSQLITNKKRFYKDRDKKFLSKKDVKDYILFVDGYIGGGTGFFSDCVLTYYLKFTNFVEIKKFQNKLLVIYNKKYKLNLNTYEEILDFIDNRTKKIFVNHISNHDINFINNLCNLSKEVSIITHDHYFIYKTQCSIFDFDNLKEDELLNVDKYNKIFTQNINNINYLERILPNKVKKKIIVNELPDFKNKLNKININNKKIKIGVLGVMSPVKGEKILNELYLKYKNKYDFFVFGIMNNKNIRQSKYNNIYELNNLLEREKPNLFISISICPETYSYTTTLMNITDLPVLFYKANNPVVKDRLRKFKEFDLRNLDIFEKNVESLKQNYLYTIEPNIYFNKIWDNYFINK